MGQNIGIQDSEQSLLWLIRNNQTLKFVGSEFNNLTICKQQQIWWFSSMKNYVQQLKLIR